MAEHDMNPNLDAPTPPSQPTPTGPDFVVAEQHNSAFSSLVPTATSLLSPTTPLSSIAHSSPTTLLTSTLPPQLELRVPADKSDVVSTLTQTLTSNGVVYITQVTLGGDYHPSDVPPATTESEGGHLTNAQIGGIIGGVAGLLIFITILWWACVRARQHARYVAWWYQNYGDESSSEGSSTVDEPRRGPRGPLGMPARGPAMGQRIRVTQRYSGGGGGRPKVATVRPGQPGPQPPPAAAFAPNATLNVQTAQWDPRNPNRARGARYAADFSKRGAWGR